MKQPLRQPFKGFFGTLSNQHRIDIIEVLRTGGEMNVTEIFNATRLKQSDVSRNLKRLEHCGFVFLKRIGKEHYYSLNQKTIRQVFDLMHLHMKNHCPSHKKMGATKQKQPRIAKKGGHHGNTHI